MRACPPRCPLVTLTIYYDGKGPAPALRLPCDSSETGRLSIAMPACSNLDTTSSRHLDRWKPTSFLVNSCCGRRCFLPRLFPSLDRLRLAIRQFDTYSKHNRRVEHVGGAMQCSYDLDLFLGNTKSKSQTIERVLHVVQKCPFANRNDVLHLLDPVGSLISV